MVTRLPPLQTTVINTVRKILVQLMFVFTTIDMAGEIAPRPALHRRQKCHLSGRIRKDHGLVKRDERGVDPASMGGMTLGTGDLVIDNMGLVRSEARIIENARSVVAGIAELIGA